MNVSHGETSFEDSICAADITLPVLARMKSWMR